MRRVLAVFASLMSAGCEIVAGIGDVTLAGSADATTSAGTDASADAAALSKGCPAPDGAGSMVRIDVVRDGGSYCIDAFEVTNAEFNAFLQSADSLPPLPSHLAPAICQSAAVGKRPEVVPDPTKAKQPAEQMGWCFAYAYCAWVGKRLCGKIGGGQSIGRDYPSYVDLGNQWDYACASGAIGSTYPYGFLYDKSACNTEGRTAVDVGASAACHGQGAPFDKIFDMSGNVAEFDDVASEHADAPDPAVAVLGGGATSAAESKCSSASGFGIYTSFPRMGFRCCADLPR